MYEALVVMEEGLEAFLPDEPLVLPLASQRRVLVTDPLMIRNSLGESVAFMQSHVVPWLFGATEWQDRIESLLLGRVSFDLHATLYYTDATVREIIRACFADYYGLEILVCGRNVPTTGFGRYFREWRQDARRSIDDPDQWVAITETLSGHPLLPHPRHLWGKKSEDP